jgi:acetoin utilization deacetylase AcuC-like enzyme
VTAALAAVNHALDASTPVFSLMRPPGHHATRDEAMGFCYLNQIAIAALTARIELGIVRVAVWDFDAHHGNGTESILQAHVAQAIPVCSSPQSINSPVILVPAPAI